MSEDLKVLPVKYSIIRKNHEGEYSNPIYGEETISIEIEDEAAGGFVVVQSNEENLKEGQIRFDLDELKLITKTAEKMLKEYEQYES